MIRHERADALAAALAGAGSARRPTTGAPSTASRRWSLGRGGRPAGTDEVARTHLAIPMSPVLDAAQAGEVTSAVREALVAAAA